MKANSIRNKQSVALRVSLPFIVNWIQFRDAVLISYLFDMRGRMTLQATANYVIGSAEITNRTGLRLATIFSLFKDVFPQNLTQHIHLDTGTKHTVWPCALESYTPYWLRSGRWRQQSVPKRRSSFCCLFRQTHNLSQSEFSCRWNLMLPLSISSTFSFP